MFRPTIFCARSDRFVDLSGLRLHLRPFYSELGRGEVWKSKGPGNLVWRYKGQVWPDTSEAARLTGPAAPPTASNEVNMRA